MNLGLYQAASALNANSRWQESIAQNLSWFMGETSLGLCDIAVVERRPSEPE